MKHILLFSFFILTLSVNSIARQDSCCHRDSVWTICLKEVKVAPNGDPVHNFYRVNKSIGTDDLLSRVPLMQMTRRGNYGWEPGMRGMSGGRINVTLDGMKIFGACTDKMDPATSYVEPQNLESFDALPGAAGAEHGSTIGGSLNLKLKDPEISAAEKFSGAVGGTGYSASSGVNGFTNLQWSHEKWAARITGVYRKHENYYGGGRRIIKNSQYEKMNFFASLKTELASHHSLKTDLLLDDGWSIGFPALPMDVKYAKARIASLTWSYSNPSRHLYQAESKVYANTIRHAMDDTHRENISMHMDMPGTSQTMGWNTMLRWKLARQLDLIGRLDFFTNTLRAEMKMYPENAREMFMLTLPKTQCDAVGVYLAPQWTIDSLTSVRAVFRMDHLHTQMKDALGERQLLVTNPGTASTTVHRVPTISLDLNRQVLETVSMNFQVARAERGPVIQVLFGYYLFNRLDGYDYIGNPDLKNEKAWQANFTIHYQRKGKSISLSPFINYVQDYYRGDILPGYSAVTEGAHGVKIYQNIDKVVLKGMELLGKISSGNHWRCMASLRYTHGSTADGLALAQTPPLKSLITVKYVHGLLSVQAETEMSAAQNRIDKLSGETGTPAWAVFHLRAAWLKKIGNNYLELNAGIENIGDTFYHEHLDWGGIPRTGRNPYLTIAWRF